MSVRISLLICFIVFTPPAFSQVATFEGGSVYDLDPKAEQSTSNHILEQMLDNDDMQAISELSPTDVIRVLAKPVGRLTLEFEKESSNLRPKGAYCTASLIGRDLIITNYHCLPGKGNVTNALLTLGYLKPRTRQGVAQYPVNLEPVETSEALDYSILRVEGNPGDEWGTITLSSQTPEALNTLFVIHHPGGFPQYVTRGRCQTNDPATDGDDMLHKCDTLPGSSGAPIFDNNTRKVVGLHYSAVALRGLNAGKRIASIAKDSALIRKLIGSSGEAVEAPRSAPPLSEAAQVWRVVHDTQSEAVLEEYVRRFSDDVYAGFAQVRLEELRKNKVAVGIPAVQQAPPSCDGVVISLGRSGSKCIKPGSGESFRDCASCPEMLVVPLGRFIMGSLESEERRDSDEVPRHRVTFGQAFAVGRYEITVAQYKQCVSDGACQQPEWLEKGSKYNIQAGSDDHYKKLGDALTGDDFPIVGVSWNNVTTYTIWLSRKTGHKYRLMSEAEWEYAARAGTQTRYSFGDDDEALSENAWYAANSSGRMHPVGQKVPNHWGLYDIHGNVWEWMADCYADSYKRALNDGNPIDEAFGCARVLRGGSWSFNPQFLRSANRFRSAPGDRNDAFGFRVARTLTP